MTEVIHGIRGKCNVESAQRLILEFFKGYRVMSPVPKGNLVGADHLHYQLFTVDFSAQQAFRLCVTAQLAGVLSQWRPLEAVVAVFI